MVRLSISLLGTFQVLLYGNGIVGFDSDKVRALLAYLVVESDRPHRREALASLLWPERPERTARHNLSQALFNLRALLDDAAVGDHPGPALMADRQAIQFNRASDHRLDVAAFTAALGACEEHPHRRLDLCEPCIRCLHQAVDLYRGSFLEGFSLGDSPPFEEWLLLQQERFHRRAVGALRRLARCHELRGEGERALGCARRHVQLEPWREDAHRQMMRLLAAAGQRNAALAQYQACRQILEAELGVEPEEGTTALYRTIRDGDELPADTSLPPHNLPAPYTPFVGRETELAEIVARLAEPDCRLLTLVGPGGSGKTRLALETARDVLYAEQGCGFTHGVYFVSLAPLQSPEAIVPAVAQAIGFAFRPGGDGRQQLLDYLRGRSMLLILDNAEHLLGECSMDPAQAARRGGARVVTDILQAAPNIKALVTSRARLNVRGEYLLPIPGMDVPASSLTDHLGAAPGNITRYSAVRLFLEGARRVRPGLQPTQSDLAHAGRICRLVQGMPLGILLAAAWMRMLSPADIAAQIGQSLDFLQDDTGDVPKRQRSMRATFDHSWHLLTGREREVFRGLSVFCGGFTPAAAEQVVGATLRELRALVDGSMLECGSAGRYEVHELLRQYGNERLGQVPGEEKVIRDRHCAYYAAFLQGREAPLTGREQGKALAEIEAEIDNVRASWDWAVAQGRIEDIDRSLESLAEFYRMRSWLQEGEEAFARAAHKLAGEGTDIGSRPEIGRESRIVFGKVLLQQGRFCDPLGLAEHGVELLQKSVAIFCELGAQREMAYALCYLGGEPSCQEALAIFKEIGDQRGIALALRELAGVARGQGGYGAARHLFQESLAIFRESGNQEEIAVSLHALGYMAWMLGEYRAAKELYQESLVLYREIGDQRGVAHSLEYLGFNACYGSSKDYGEAQQLLQESLALYEEIGDLYGMAVALQCLGDLADLLGEYAKAIQLAQRSLALASKWRDATHVLMCLRVLGRAACGLGDLKGERRYLHQALGHALEMALTEWAIPWVLATFDGIAMLLAGEGERERALEILTLAVHHPASIEAARDIAASLVAQLAAELPPDVVAAAQERGRARDLDATVVELLAELTS